MNLKYIPEVEQQLYQTSATTTGPTHLDKSPFSGRSYRAGLVIRNSIASQNALTVND